MQIPHYNNKDNQTICFMSYFTPISARSFSFKHQHILTKVQIHPLSWIRRILDTTEYQIGILDKLYLPVDYGLIGRFGEIQLNREEN